MPLKDEHKRVLMALAKEDAVHYVAPPVDCEICGHPMPSHADALNLAFTVQVGVPGHPALTVIHCPMPEHWACSIECWRKMADNCLDNDIIPLLEHAHERVGRQKPVSRRPS